MGKWIEFYVRSSFSKKKFITSDQGAIIGKNGARIKGIRLTTGAMITFKDNKDPKTCTVRIIGTMTEKEAAEKRIRHIMDEVDKTANLDEQIFELKVWKKSLGYNIGEKIRLKCCTKFARGRCNLTEVSIKDMSSVSKLKILQIECPYTHPESGAEIVDDHVITCNKYLVYRCKKSMIECRKAHRSKSFIESKLQTQIESEDVETDCPRDFENKTSFSLEGCTQFDIETDSLDSISVFSTF